MNNLTISNIIGQQIDVKPEKINALVSTITMKDGSKSKILTVFDNNNVEFDSIELGVCRGLQNVHEVDFVSSELFSVSENGLRSSGIVYPERKNDFNFQTH